MCIYIVTEHCLLRIGTSLRLGSPSDVRLERFVEAVLTHTALVGSRKQSVEDVERLFGLPLIEFMEEKQYTSEAKYL